MEKKYFAVTTKCGHVGKGKFIIKTFAVVASDGKDAAEIARWLPRVKHHNKECILDVKKISEEMFQVLLEENSKDLYFQCRNVQEQKEKCPEIYEDVQNLYSKSKDYKFKTFIFLTVQIFALLRTGFVCGPNASVVSGTPPVSSGVPSQSYKSEYILP